MPSGAGGFLVRRGADLVHVVEGLYVRLFVLTLVLLALGSGWSVWARLADAQRGQLVLTVAFAALGVVTALAGIVLRRRAYRWLRYNRARQSLPGVVAVVILLADGPHSATWWMAFALLFVMASVSSTSLTLLAALFAAGAYIGGTLIYGSALIYHGDMSNLVGAAMLVVDALVARAVTEVFGSYVLHLHRLETQIAEAPVAPPIKVANLAGSPAEPQREPAPSRSARRRALNSGGSRLTARQLEVALLIRDGLHAYEIANCLAISQRQVERLSEQARTRVGAATTSELVAMLVRGRLLPAREA
jgi:DNA-binding CsgD family transcriptional regulator